MSTQFSVIKKIFFAIYNCTILKNRLALLKLCKKNDRPAFFTCCGNFIKIKTNLFSLNINPFLTTNTFNNRLLNKKIMCHFYSKNGAVKMKLTNLGPQKISNGFE